jgi:exodeoxyribonuclease V alpha subunit
MIPTKPKCGAADAMRWLLKRELSYTAVTRAKAKIGVVGSESSVRAAVERRSVRASGLGRRLRDSQRQQM